MRITAIERQPGGRRVTVYVDGAPALTLNAGLPALATLRTGDSIDAARLAEVQDADARHGAVAFSLRLIAYRARSEAEMRKRLARRGAAADVVEETVARLRELALLDDDAFAASWAETRDRTSPRSRRLIAAELAARGVERTAAEKATAPLDEAAAAYRAALRRSRSLAGLPFSDFQRRLGAFLLGRGFSFHLAEETVARVWEETREG